MFGVFSRATDDDPTATASRSWTVQEARPLHFGGHSGMYEGELRLHVKPTAGVGSWTITATLPAEEAEDE